MLIAHRQVLLSLPTLSLGLCSIKPQPCILHAPPRPGRKHQIRIQRRAPTRQEPLLDLPILRQAGFSHLLARQRISLQSGSERVLSARRGRVGLDEQLAAGEGGASDGVGEGFGLGLRAGGSGEGRLGFGGGFGVGEEVDLVGYGASEVVEGLADVGGVVIGFVGVLRASR